MQSTHWPVAPLKRDFGNTSGVGSDTSVTMVPVAASQAKRYSRRKGSTMASQAAAKRVERSQFPPRVPVVPYWAFSLLSRSAAVRYSLASLAMERSTCQSSSLQAPSVVALT